MQEGGLKRGIFAIFSANIINLIFNLMTNFLLPKYLSVDSYSAIKTFQLYTNYVGLFSIGYADGMYLRYGGRNINNINIQELKSGMLTYRLILIIESLILIPVMILSKDKILIAFSFTVLSKNMTSYFKNLYQAVGEFKRYGEILNWTTIATFVANIALLLIIKSDSYMIYLISYALVDLFIWVALEFNAGKFIDYRTGIGDISFGLVHDDVVSGFILMVGNFSNILLSSMDRWFVKIMMNSNQFAFYSFAVSMEGFLNVAITPITTTLYNYFCNHSSNDDVIRTRRYVLILGSIIIAAAFPAKFIIEIFLRDYINSVSVLFILFATQMIYVLIKGIYINLYKATRKQNLYFFRLVLVLLIGGILNYIFIKIYPYKESLSYGTLVSALFWLTFSILDFKQYGFEFKEWVYLITEILSLIIFGQIFESLVGLLLYTLSTVFMMFVFMRTQMKNLFLMVKNMLVKHT